MAKRQSSGNPPNGDDDLDTEAHRLATNDNETMLEDLTGPTPEVGDGDTNDQPTAPEVDQAL